MSASVEYDVLVKLRVDRTTQRGLGDAAKPLAAGFSKLERDRARAQRAEAARQKAAGRDFLSQQLASERALAKGLAQRARADAAQRRVAAREVAQRGRAEAKAAAASAAMWRGRMAATRGGLGNVAGMFMGSPGMGGGGMGGSVPSDRRLKKDIEHVLIDAKGRDWFDYRYVWQDDDEPKQRGVMAQQMLTTDPQAVSLAPTGYLQVNYGALS